MHPSSRTRPTSPEALWRAWRSRGDDAAFARLVRGHTRYAADLARRAGARADEAEDAVQDALLRLAEETSDDPLRYGIRAWLCRRVVLGVRMRARSEGRRRRREQRRASDRAAGARAEHGPLGAQAAAEGAAALEAQLAELPIRDRAAVVLRHLYGMSYADVAFVLGIKKGTCRTRVHRAMRRLQNATPGRLLPNLALIGVPALAREGALVAGAAGASGGAAASGSAAVGTIATWKMAAAGAAAACVAGAAVVMSQPAGEPAMPPPAPPPVVAAAEPDPPPAPAPAPPAERLDVGSPALMHLEKHLTGELDATSGFWSARPLDRLFPAPEGKAPLHVAAGAGETPLDLNELARTGRPIVLEAGTYRLVATLAPPEDVRIHVSGAGMRETRLLAPHDAPAVRPRGELSQLVVRDLTLEGDAVRLDDRGALLFRRVRFRGWRDRVGYSAPVGIRAPGLIVFDACTFVGGYRGRAAGYALGVRSSVLALFHACHVADVAAAVAVAERADISPRSLVHAVDSMFDGARLAHPRRETDGATARLSIRVRDSRVAALPELASWRQRVRRFHAGDRDDLVGIEYLPATHRSTFGELKQVLSGYRPPAGRQVVAIETLGWVGATERLFAVHTVGVRGARRADVVELDAAGHVHAAKEGRARPPRDLPFRPGRSLDLRRLVEVQGWGVPEAARLAGIAIHRNTNDDSLLFGFDRYRDQVDLDRLAAPR